MQDINEINNASEVLEEPIVVAQRYFNIFRQIHIFNDNKKERFNQELISLPNDVLKALNSIPGGGLLLEYISEQKGEDPSILAEFCNINGNPQGGIEVNGTCQPLSGFGGKIGVDETFSAAISQAITESQEKLLESIRLNPPELTIKSSNLLATGSEAGGSFAELATVFKETQSEIAKMIIDFKEAQRNNANNIQINTGPQGYSGAPQIEYNINDMVAQQISSLQEVTKNHFQELGSTIAFTIKESQEMSSKTITEAIASLSKENMDILKNLINYKIAESQPTVLETGFNDTSYINPQIEKELKSKKLDPVFNIPKAPIKKEKTKEEKKPLFELPEPKVIKEKLLGLDDLALDGKKIPAEKKEEIIKEVFSKPEEIKKNTPKETSSSNKIDSFLLDDDTDLSLDDLIKEDPKPITQAPNENKSAKKIEFQPTKKQDNTKKTYKSTIDWTEVASTQPNQEILENKEEEIKTSNWGFDNKETQTQDDYEWEYVEEDDTTDNNQTQTLSENEDDYEWEYVEEDDATDNSQAQALNKNDEEDYEWEYVEDDGLSDDDYEWEYIEEDDETNDKETPNSI